MNVKKLASLMKYLLYLNSAIKTGSINIAAQDNGIKPANLSKAISEFEDIIGYKLLQRSTKGVKPTFAGRKIYQLALSLEERLSAFEQMTEKSNPADISLFISPNLQLCCLEEFAKSHPDLTILLVDDQQKADIAILNQLPDDPRVEYVQFYDGSVIRQPIWLTCRRQDTPVLVFFDFIISQLHL